MEKQLIRRMLRAAQRHGITLDHSYSAAYEVGRKGIGMDHIVEVDVTSQIYREMCVCASKLAYCVMAPGDLLAERVRF